MKQPCWIGCYQSSRHDIQSTVLSQSRKAKGILFPIKITKKSGINTQESSKISSYMVSWLERIVGQNKNNNRKPKGEARMKCIVSVEIYL